MKNNTIIIAILAFLVYWFWRKDQTKKQDVVTPGNPIPPVYIPPTPIPVNVNTPDEHLTDPGKVAADNIAALQPNSTNVPTPVVQAAINNNNIAALQGEVPSIAQKPSLLIDGAIDSAPGSNKAFFYVLNWTALKFAVGDQVRFIGSKLYPFTYTVTESIDVLDRPRLRLNTEFVGSEFGISVTKAENYDAALAEYKANTGVLEVASVASVAQKASLLANGSIGYPPDDSTAFFYVSDWTALKFAAGDQVRFIGSKLYPFTYTVTEAIDVSGLPRLRLNTSFVGTDFNISVTKAENYDAALAELKANTEVVAVAPKLNVPLVATAAIAPDVLSKVLAVVRLDEVGDTAMLQILGYTTTKFAAGDQVQILKSELYPNTYTVTNVYVSSGNIMLSINTLYIGTEYNKFVVKV